MAFSYRNLQKSLQKWFTGLVLCSAFWFTPAGATDDPTDPLRTSDYCAKSLGLTGPHVQSLIGHNLTSDFHGEEPALTSTELDFDPSKLIAGRYQFIRTLGQGAQGTVIEAKDALLHRKVAIKISARPISDHPEVWTRMQQEAATLAKLEHPNVCRVYDLGRGEQFPYMVMQFLAGEDLHRFRAEQEIPYPEIAAIVAKIARGLGALHEHGIVHRDVKPQNVLLQENGEPKLLDVGLAVPIDQGESTAESGHIYGTPAYLSPEQALAKNNEVDAQSDIYGLGGILYYLITGKPPYKGSTVLDTVMAAAQSEWDRTALDVAPRTLRNIVLKAMAAEKANRYASALNMAKDLERFAAPKRKYIGWVTAAGIALLLFGWIAIENWDHLIGNVPPPHIPGNHSNGGNGGGVLPAEKEQLPVSTSLWVARGEDETLELSDALPIRTKDGLQMVSTVPEGVQVGVFWIGSDGKIHEADASQVKVVASRLQAKRNRVIYPGQGQFTDVEGQTGTEVVFIVGSPNKKPTKAEFESALNLTSGPLPALPDSSAYELTGKGVRLLASRAPGAVRIRPNNTAQIFVQSLRTRLTRKYPLVSGFAFPHRKPEQED